MKRIFLNLLLFCVSVTLIHAQKEEISYSRLNNTFNLKVNSSSEKLKLTVQGDVKLGDDDKTISSLSPNGEIVFTVKKILNTSLSEKQYSQVLAIVDNIKSDYYRSEILKMLLSNNDLSDEKFATTVNRTSDIIKSYI
jgi:hypothetical protein